jgi:hypothetical protein
MRSIIFEFGILIQQSGFLAPGSAETIRNSLVGRYLCFLSPRIIQSVVIIADDFKLPPNDSYAGEIVLHSAEVR